jgi:hypothetical protein
MQNVIESRQAASEMKYLLRETDLPIMRSFYELVAKTA